MNVYAELKCTGTCECVAVHVKSIFGTLKALKGSLNYTIEGVQSELKDNKEYGELSHNVSYKSKNSFVTRRSMVIRKNIWDKFVWEMRNVMCDDVHVKSSKVHTFDNFGLSEKTNLFFTVIDCEEELVEWMR